MKMYKSIFLITIFISEITSEALVTKKVPVNKCCPKFEIIIDNNCGKPNETDVKEWIPVFTNEDGLGNIQVNYELIIGEPDCRSTQRWPVLHYQNSLDQLILLPNGKLRHYAYQNIHSDFEIKPSENEFIRYHDYEPGQYCLDKVGFILHRQKKSDSKTRCLYPKLITFMKLLKIMEIHLSINSQYALVCFAESYSDWHNVDFLMRKVINPIFHAIGIICFLFVAITYFIMPTLRDLTGNIITTISVCLIVSQAADMVQIFTEFSNHVSFMVSNIFCYTSLLGAFFWLNSLGYYIWKTFKSRNVFLRVTDGKKYCYYSIYAWSCTIIMGAIAVFAHFALELPKNKISVNNQHNQEVIGSLGMTIYFTPIAFTILINVFFYARTLQIINRINIYGIILHKLKHTFRMFLLVSVIMSVTWLFMLLSWLHYEALVYCYIVINALQAPLFLYVCIFNQKHVVFLLRNTCCYSSCICPCCRPEPQLEWGDEMTAMNSGI